jgi:hypothetical protein
MASSAAEKTILEGAPVARRIVQKLQVDGGCLFARLARLACLERHRRSQMGRNKGLRGERLVDCHNRFAGLAFWSTACCSESANSGLHSTRLDLAAIAGHTVELLRQESMKMVVLAYAED